MPILSSLQTPETQPILGTPQSSMPTSANLLGLEIPESLRSLADEVEESRWMLELEDDWDGEGSSIYSLEIWEQAVSFLLRNAITLWNQVHTVVDTPKIHNGPNGSIDLYWDASERKLLLNIPPYKKGEITFYAYDTKGNDIKGSLSPHSEPLWLFLWQGMLPLEIRKSELAKISLQKTMR